MPLRGDRIGLETADRGAAVTPELGDGYAAALTNYVFMANEVLSTEEAVQAMTSGS